MTTLSKVTFTIKKVVSFVFTFFIIEFTAVVALKAIRAIITTITEILIK
jgi:hypothetical protein